MSKEIRTSRAPQHALPFSQAILAGEFLYVSGQTGVDPETLKFVGFTIEDQVKQTVKNIASILNEAGLSLDHVTKVNAYLADIRDVDAYNKTYQQLFSHPYPARTTVICGIGEALVEIDVVAYRGNRRTDS